MFTGTSHRRHRAVIFAREISQGNLTQHLRPRFKLQLVAAVAAAMTSLPVMRADDPVGTAAKDEDRLAFSAQDGQGGFQFSQASRFEEEITGAPDPEACMGLHWFVQTDPAGSYIDFLGDLP